MTSATVATKPAAAQSGQSQAKPEKIRKDHSINWWLTAAVAVLSLTVLVPLYFAVVTALKTPGEAGTFSLPTTWEQGELSEGRAQFRDHHRVRCGADAADEHVRRVRRGKEHG